jgi:ABC-type transport system involved in multi-copper enzyme maturation permease subunit
MLIAALSARIGSWEPTIAEVEQAYGTAYAVFVLRWCVFFGCVVTFVGVFRSDVIDRTLHYWLLAPVRRDALVAGKYLAGVVAAGGVLGVATAVSALLAYAPFDSLLARERLASGGLELAANHVLVTLLACVGYGAVFLLIGIAFRNPIVPTMAVLGWEYINFLLPPALRAASVTYYLQSLLPMPLTEGPLGMVAEPAPAWLAVTGLVAFSIVLLAVSAWRLRRTEVVYGDE